MSEWTCVYGHSNNYVMRNNARTGAPYPYCLTCPHDPVARSAQPRVKPAKPKTKNSCSRGHEYTQHNTLCTPGHTTRQCVRCRFMGLMARDEGLTGDAYTARVDQFEAVMDEMMLAWRKRSA